MSHLSAAAVFGLPLPLGCLPDVHLTAIEAVQRTRRENGVWVHHCDSMLTPTVVVAGLRVTLPGRMIADCLRCFPARVSVPVADSALHGGLTSIEVVAEVLEAQEFWPGRDAAWPRLTLVDGRRES